MPGEPGRKHLKAIDPGSDPDVEYWIDQFRKNGLSGVNAAERFSIMINVTLCKDKILSREERIKAISKTLKIQEWRAARVLKALEEIQEAKGV